MMYLPIVAVASLSGALLALIGGGVVDINQNISFPWAPHFGLFFSFTVDPLSQLFLFAVGIVTVVLFPYAALYFKEPRERDRTIAILFLFFVGMAGSVAADNVLLLFIFWEITSLTSFLLIGTKGDSEYARKAARTALLVTAGGGVGLLVAAVGLRLTTGTFELCVILQDVPRIVDSPWGPSIVGGILLAALTKSAQFPFHFWLPGAMAAPTPISAYLHSATMVKLGVYLLIRMYPLLSTSPFVLQSLLSIGALTFALTAARAFAEPDFKKTLAFTTTSALGLMVALIGMGTPKALLAAGVFFLCHVFYKGALFMLLGAMYVKVHTYRLAELGHPRSFGFLIAAATVISLLSLIGFPPLLGFVAKEVILKALFSHPPGVLLVLFLGGGVICTVAVGVRVLRTLWVQPVRSEFRYPLLSNMALISSALAVGTIAIPFFLPTISGRFFLPLAEQFGAPVASTPPLALWYGFNGAFIASMGALGVGALMGIYERLILKRGEPFWRMVMFLQFDHQFSRWIDRFLVWTKTAAHRLQPERLSLYVRVTIISVLLIVGSQLEFLPHREGSAPIGPASFLACLLMITGGVATFFMQSRLGAILVLSQVGLGVTLIFATFGAPDLAITQILVEAITLVLFIFFMYRLPSFRPPVSTTSQVWNVLVAVLTGIVVASATYATTPVLPDMPLENYFLVNAYPRAFGENVVNTILVDFRALDTLGEITVLAIAAIGVHALLRRRTS